MLQFLRSRKFSNIEAHKRYEKTLEYLATYPEWFENLTLDDQKLLEIYETGYVVPFKERDVNGCKVVLFRSSKTDTKFSYIDYFRLVNLVTLTYMEEPETQIAGTVIIINAEELTFEKMNIFPVPEVIKYMKLVMESSPLRMKKIILANVPTFGAFVFDLVRNTLSEKLNKRFVIMSNDEIRKEFDSKILPVEYGGKVPLEEMQEDFKEVMRLREKKIKLIIQQKVDLKSLPRHDDVDVGSFKKLEID